MYKRHIFTLLNEVSPVQIYKSESTNKSRPLYLFFYISASTIFIFTINFHLEYDDIHNIKFSSLHFKAVLVVWMCCKEKFGNVPNDNAGLHFLADHNIWTAKQERLIVTN